MRIVTPLPPATEIVAAVAPAALVGVSHHGDYPAWVTTLPRVTKTSVDVNATSAEIDAQVRALKADGKPVIWVDAAALEALRPDLIVTQGLCEVCAVADGEVFRVAERLDPKPQVLSLNAKMLAGIYEDARSVGRAVGRSEEADEVVAGMKYKLSQLRKRAPLSHPERSEGSAGAPASHSERSEESARPRVVVVEWLDPLFLAGHWVPELIEAAGGLDVGAKPGDHSHPRPWSDLMEMRPDIIIVALCGFSVERAKVEWETQLPAEAMSVLANLPSCRLTFIDGNTYTSRPGPRVVEGLSNTTQRTR